MGTISKVTAVQANGTWESKYGLMYRFDYEFEDGTMLQASHQKPENAFPKGSEVEYEVIKDDPKYGKSGKVKKPEVQNPVQQHYNNASPEQKSAIQKAIIYQSAFKEAVGYHNIAGFKLPNTFDELCSTADAIAQFVIKKSGI